MADDLPLTDLSFHILMAVADEPLHGYALVMHLRDHPGREALRTGTVYAALARLQDAGWVVETDPPDADSDARRRYYRITADGLRIARAEAARLRDVVAMARGKALLQEPARG